MTNDEIMMQTNLIDTTIEHVKALPPTEIKYYLTLLVASIKNDQTKGHLELLTSVDELTVQFNEYYTSTESQETKLNKLMDKLNVLVAASHTNTLSHQVKKTLLKVCSFVLGFVVGVSSGLIGMSIGVFSDWTILGNLHGAYLGLFTGLSLGSYAGSRIINKAFQSDVERKLDFCVSGIEKVSKELPDRLSQADYRANVKQQIMDDYCTGSTEDKEAQYQQFLHSEQSFQVATTTAQFVSKQLKGHLGHHFLIRYKLNFDGDKIEAKHPMEFGGPSRMPKYVDQNELGTDGALGRKVTGEQLVEMIMMDNILQETHPYDMSFMTQQYDIGSNDCRTYADKILIATNQAPTQVSRFNPAIDKWTGKTLVAPLVRFFSTTKETELNCLSNHFEDENQVTSQHRTWAPGAKVDF